MQTVKRVVTVTHLTKPNGETKEMVGNFNVMREIKAGWRIEDSREFACEMPLDKFYGACDSKIPVAAHSAVAE